MGCSVSRRRRDEGPLTPKATAPPPPPLSAFTYVAETTMDDCQVALVPTSLSTVFGGVGFSSSLKSEEAAHESLGGAAIALTAKLGKPTNPSLAILTCGEAIEDAEEVRCEIVRAFPDVRVHGVASVSSLLTPHGESSGSSGSRRKPMRRTGNSAAGGVGCLLLEAPDGSFAAAWDDTGDALYAAKWLQEQMPTVQAIIMATVPADEEKALESLQSVFPGVPVHGRNGVEATNWLTLSHLGSAPRGVSLVGIAPHVGFGAASADVPNRECSKMSLAACFQEVHDAAKVAGDLKTVHAAILTCSGLAVHEGGVKFSIFDVMKEQFGDLPILGVSTDENAKRDGQAHVSIGFMLFGERHPQSNVVLDKARGEELQSTCAEIPCMEEGPGTPSTASTEARYSPRLTTI